MTKIKSFDKQNLKEIRKEIDEALAKVAKENGIKLSIGAISFQSDTFTTKITATTMTKSDALPGNARWQVNFKRLALYSDGFKNSDLGRIFNYRGTAHMLVGAMGANAVSGEIVLMNIATKKFIRVDAEIVKTKMFVDGQTK